MLTGKELGDAIRLALEQNGKTQADAARHFDIKPPSVSGWIGTGRISKGNFNELTRWLSKTPMSHWGLRDGFVPQDTGETSEDDRPWILDLVDYDLYMTLTELERYQVQVHMQDEIKEILSDRKSNGTDGPNR